MVCVCCFCCGEKCQSRIGSGRFKGYSLFSGLFPNPDDSGSTRESHLFSQVAEAVRIGEQTPKH